MFVTLFYIALLLGVIVFALLLFLKLNPAEKLYIKPFIWLVFVATIYEFIAFKSSWNIVLWSKIYTSIEFVILCLFYYNILNKRHKIFFYSCFFIFLCLFCYLLSIGNIAASNNTESYLTTFTTVFVVIASILWFISIFIDEKKVVVLESANYYFVSGFLIYYTSTFFLFLIGDYLLKNFASEFLSYWNLIIFFNIVLRTFLIIGIWKAKKK